MKTSLNLMLLSTLSFSLGSLSAERDPADFVELKWDHESINIQKNRDVILVDTGKCMIQCPSSINEGSCKYDGILMEPSVRYIWVSVSGISNEMSFLNYGPVTEEVIDVSNKISSGRYIIIEGLNIEDKYFIYKLNGDKVDPYFFHSSFGLNVIEFRERIQPGKYLILAKRNGAVRNQKMIEVIRSPEQIPQKFFWDDKRDETLENTTTLDFRSLRGYSEISSLCELYYQKFQNAKYSRFAYSYGQMAPEDRK